MSGNLQDAESRDTAQIEPLDTSSLQDIVAVLRTRLWFIVKIALVFLAAGIALALLLTPKYEATTRLLIDPRGVQLLNKDVTPDSQSPAALAAIVESQIRVMTSDNVLNTVVQENDLENDPEFTEPGITTIVMNWVLETLGIPIDPPNKRLKALRELKKVTEATRTPESYVADLSVTTEKATKSARLANSIADTYFDTEVLARAGIVRKTETSLNARLSELRQNVKDSEDRVEEFKRANDIVDAAGESVAERKLAQLSSDLVRVRAEATDAKIKYDQIRTLQQSGRIPDSVAETISAPTIVELRGQLAEARQREMALSAQLRPGHPAMQQVRAQVASLRSDIAAELSRIGQSTLSDWKRAQENEEKLEAEVERTQASVLAKNEARVRLRELEREAEANRAVYEAFLVRAREVAPQQDLDKTLIRILSPAVPPASAKGLSIPLLVALFLAAGIGAGSGLALIRERLHPRVRNPQQVRNATGLPVIAELPISRSSLRKSGRERAKRNAPADDAFGYAYERLRQFDQWNRGQAIVIASADPGKDSSTVALELATVAATRGESVLLVDADLRRQALTTSGIPNAERGLGDIVEGSTPFSDVALRDEYSTLSFIPNLGPGSVRPSDLTPDRIGTRLFSPARKEFDLLLVDGGCLTTDGSALVFADASDCSVIVARRDETALDALVDAANAIEGLGKRCQGVFLTTA